MFKFLVIVGLLLTSIPVVQAQQAVPAAGGDASGSAGTAAYSVGQVLYNSYVAPAGTESQGVQQPYDLVKVVSVAPLPLIQTPWSIAPILPSKVNILLSEGQLISVGVTWDTSALLLFRRGIYTLSGTLTLPNYIGNTAQVRAQIRIQVLPKPAPVDFILNNSSFEASKTSFFIPVGAFVITDPVDNVHLVSLFGPGYDNGFFEIKDNILFWSSSDPAPGRSSFTVLAQVIDRDGNTLEKFFEIQRSRPLYSTLTIYNTFSPNGDGINETWSVPELKFYQGVRIQIFDRGGQRVFYTEQAAQGWDGTHLGHELPIGTYYWIIDVGELGESRRGLVNLLRK